MKRHLLTLAILLAATPALAQYDMTADLPGADTPPSGRSLFDYLAAGDDGSTEVPFPIEKLIARLSTRAGVQPQVTMIPKGRSLQRDHADYASPRLVFAFTDNGRPSGNELGVLAQDRLYIGFAEKGDQLEVISYNAAAGRYEFQLVKEYHDGGAKKIVYADRVLCTKCHHGGSPIFSPELWPETNGTGSTQSEQRVAQLIKSAQNGQDTYHTYPVSVPQAVPYKISESVKRANLIMPQQKLWTDGCGRDEPEAVACRGNVLKLALEMAFNGSVALNDSSEAYKAVKASWEKYWATYLKGGLIIPTPFILRYDPLVDQGAVNATNFADLNPAGLSAQQQNAIKGILAGSSVPKDVDPLVQFLEPIDTWTLDHACFGNCVVYAVKRFLTEEDRSFLRVLANQDFTKMAAAVDALVQKKDPALANRAFRRGVVIRALSRELGGPDIAGGFDTDAPTLPPLALDTDTTTPNDGTPLSLVKTYCSPCHQTLPDQPAGVTPGKRGFLKGTDAEMLAKIKIEAPEMWQRLNWEAAPVTGHNFMPPKADAKHTALAAKPADRKTIMDWLKEIMQ